MQFHRLLSTSLVVAISAGAAIVACGGSSKSTHPDGNNNMPDAKTFMDGSSSGGLTLGKACGSAADCPASAPDCIAIGLGGGSASPSYCTPECDSNATGTTNGSGQFTSLTPPPNNAACTGAYTGAGSAACSLLLKWTPMDNPLKNNKQYTGVTLGCLVHCGTGNTCAAGMTCNTSVMLCFPS